MSKLLKTGSAYGARIAHGIVFTRAGAIERYKVFLSVCYNPLSIGSAAALDDAEEDMVATGFSRDELEQMEIEFLEGGAK